jgi:hypothetical protein
MQGTKNWQNLREARVSRVSVLDYRCDSTRLVKTAKRFVPRTEGGQLT